MNHRRRTRNKQCSSSSGEDEVEEDFKPQKLQKTGRRNRSSALDGETPARKPVWYWSEFNNWWRTELERLGKRPGKPSIVQWYEANAKRVWPHETPTFQETRLHAKCLRSTEAVRDYFRRYRAARKEQQLEGEGHSNGGANADAAASVPTLTKQERHWNTRHAAPSIEGPPMDPITLIMQHNQRIAEQQARQTLTQAQPQLLPQPQLPFVHGGLPPLSLVPRTLNWNSDGGSSVSSAFGPMVTLGAAADACKLKWASTPLDATRCVQVHQPTSIECSAGQAEQTRHETCSPFSTPGASPGANTCGPMAQIRSNTAPVAAPPLPQSWFTGGGDRAIEESAGGFGHPRLGGHVGTAVVQAVVAADSEVSRQAWEKRRSDRSSATDDGGPGRSRHAGDPCDSEEHDMSECDRDDGHDDELDAVEEDEACQRETQPRLRRSDTPFFRQGFKTVIRDDTSYSEEMQQQQQLMQQHDLYGVAQQQDRPLAWRRQEASGLSLMRVRQLQAPPPLQLPPGDMGMLNSRPYSSYATANVVGSCGAVQPLLVHCSDAHGPVFPRHHELKQHELLVQEQAMSLADPTSPTSLLIASPPLPLMPLRPDDCLLTTGLESGLNPAATGSQQGPPRVKEEQVHHPHSQSLLEQEDCCMSISMSAPVDSGGGCGHLPQIDEEDAVMDEETEDDDEGVPEVFWD